MAKKQKIKMSPATSDVTDKASGFIEELCEEKDRGAALVAAAFLDYTLEVMMRSVFVSNAKVQKTLFDYTGPLASFASKIDIVYALGLEQYDGAWLSNENVFAKFDDAKAEQARRNDPNLKIFTLHIKGYEKCSK